MKKKTILGLSVLSTAVILLAGCGGGGAGKDSTKTQIGIFNWAGGYGSEWLRSLTSQYAELVKDTSFEEGKKGVEFTLVQEKEHQDSVAKIKGLTSIDIVFDENIQYNMYSKSGCFKDITEIATAENKYDGGKRIIDKMSEEQKSGLYKDNKYYSLPGYAGSMGITYNKDLMNSDSLYFKQGGGFTNAAGSKTVGPDGVAGTYDDGLPSTKEEFIKLCKQAKSKNRVPLIGAGSPAAYYGSSLINNLAATYDGGAVASGRLDCNVSGVSVIDLTDPTKTSSVDVTTANGYELMRSAGLYQGFSLFETLFKEGYMIDWDENNSTIFNSSITNLAGQKYFIEGCHNGKQALMLIEGDWWFNEAADVVNKKYGSDLSKANFGWMPMPTNSGSGHTYAFDSINDMCYVREGIDSAKWSAIKDFLLYAYSDSSLNNFTKVTNTRWNLDYELTAEVKASLNPFGKDLMEYYASEKTHIIPVVSQNPFFIKNEGSLVPHHMDYIKLSASKNIINYLYDDKKFGKTALQYTNELYNIWKNKGIWE